MIDNYKHIIWDWNGTLFNDVELSVDIINSLLAGMGIKILSIEDYREIFTFPVKDYYEKAGVDFSRHSFETVGKQWIEEYERRRLEGKVYAGAEDVLKFIAGKGIEQSILSAYSQKTLVEIVSHFGLTGYFTHLSGLDNIYADSKIELGRNFIQMIGGGDGNVLLIGDTVHDFEVASEIGADCLLIADGHQSREKLLQCGVPVLKNITNIYNF